VDSIISTGLIGISLGAQYTLLSVGFTLIFGILGVINFSHGGFYILGGYTAYALTHLMGVPYPLAVLGATVAAAGVGYAIEYLVVEPHVDNHLTTMMITLGFYLIATTGFTVAFGPEPPEFRFPVTGAFRSQGFFIPYSNLIVLAVGAVVICGVYLIMYKTSFGISLRAMADDRAVATAQGMRPTRLFPMAFALATGLAGLTGALVTPILALSPHGGDAVLATSFMVVILGGLGSLGGATIASFIVGMVEAYSSVYLGGSKGALALFVLVLVILVFRPSGLMGREVRKA
jgi:branched-chain amino acid transport system permease protein